jgi:outer membrane lipoprotein carrier protein
VPRCLAWHAAVLLAGCHTPGDATSASSGSVAPDPPRAAASAPVEASAPAPSIASASATAASSAAASADPAPPAKAELPKAEPLPVRRPKPSAVPPAKPVAKEAAADAGAATDAGAPVSPARKIALDVDAIFAAKKTYTARFAQHYVPKFTGSAKDSTGVLFAERPDKISFRYDPPNNNRIVSDGTTVKVYMAEDKQMFETPMQKTQYPGALAFLMGNGIASSFDFAIKNPTSSSQTYAGTILEGRPLIPNPSYDTVTFFIAAAALASRDPGAIERVTVVDAQGNKNRFDFTNAAQPATVNPAEFTFTPPPGTTITR